MRRSNRRRSAETSPGIPTWAAAGAVTRAIRLASLAALALGLTLAASAPADAQMKRLSMNVKIGANTLHTPAYGSVEARRERPGDVTDVLGRVDMPPQRQYKVGGACRFSRGGIPIRSLKPGALRLPARVMSLRGEGDVSAQMQSGSSLRKGRLSALVLTPGMNPFGGTRGEIEGGEVLAETFIEHNRPGDARSNSPRKAFLSSRGAAETTVTQNADATKVPARSSRAGYTAGIGSGGGPHARQPGGRQVVVEVVNRRPRPAYLRLEGAVEGGITPIGFTTNAGARIGYMRLRCGTPYGKGKAKVLVHGGAPAAPGGGMGTAFSQRKNQQLRIGRGRHQLWIETMAGGEAVGFNLPESEVLHDSVSIAKAELGICLLNRRGGRC